MTWSESLAPFRGRNFRYYFAARSVNTLGNMMATVALAFAVLEITDDDPAALGQVLAAHTVPMVVLLLWGGVVADRFPRALVLQTTNVGSALSQGAIAILVLSGRAELWHLVVLSAFHGALTAANLPALAGIMPQLVPREQLQRANALESMVRNTLRVLGPTGAALLVVTVGPGWALALDAATWLASAALLGFVRIPPRAASGEQPSVLAELRDGWGYVRSTTWLWVVVLGFGVLNMIHSGAWNTLGPAHAKDTVGVEGWGLILSAEAVGLLLTTVVMLRVPLRRPLLWGMVGTTLYGLPIVVFGAAPELWLMVLIGFVAGAGIEVFGLGWNLAMQENVPERMLSRVYSYDMLGSYVAMPIGQLAFGPLAVAFGFTPVLVTAGLVYVAICLLVLCSSAVRGLSSPPATATVATSSSSTVT